MAPPPSGLLEEDEPFQQRWEELWAQGLKPGDLFDKHLPLPELAKQLSDGSLPRSGTALVPGCGRGYDVDALCRAGYAATGMDISPTAISAAKEYLASVSTPGEYHVTTADFFTAPLGPYDLVYDYTFFCAIEPESRALWGARMAELVKPGGSLITVMYPTEKPLQDGGPPFGVSEQAYRDVLADAFRAVDGPRLLDADSAHPERDGSTYWCRWKRV